MMKSSEKQDVISIQGGDMKKIMWIALGAFIFNFMAGVAVTAAAAEAQLLTTEALSKMLDDPDVVIVDVRTERDWKTSDSKIKGAVREDPGNVSFWLSKYSTDKTLVFYCA